jgi:hypothetical protein
VQILKENKTILAGRKPGLFFVKHGLITAVGQLSECSLTLFYIPK